MSAITDNLPAIGWGLLVTLVISVLSYLGGLLLGSLMAIFRVGPIPPLRALGMPFGLIIRGIVLPQALARTIQPLVNIFIACLIGSSLAAAIGVVELTAVTQRINQERAAGVITFLTSGLTYLAIAFAATKLGGLLERRLEFMGRGRA